MTEKHTADHLPSFGEEAHRVLARTRAAAYRLRHATLGTEHLLIGCAEEAHGQAAEVLYRAGVTPALILSCVNLLGNRTVAKPSGDLQMAAVLRAALRTAREEAQRLRDGEVRSEHLLLAIVRERTGGGAVVLRAMGQDLRALSAAAVRQGMHDATEKGRAAWIARGPYGTLAVVGLACVLGAIAFTVRWFATVPSGVRSAYVFELLIPVALLSLGMVGLGASWVEAARQAVERESLLALWASRSAAAQMAAALDLAQQGQVETAAEHLETVADRPMPDTDVRAASAVLARWLASERLAPYGYMGRGLLRAHAGQLPAALADFDAAVRLRPDDVRWQGLYGTWLARSARDDEAYPRLQQADAASAEPLVTLELALLALRRGDADRAEALAQKVARAMPGASRPLGVLAAARFLQGATESCKEALREVLLPDAQDVLTRTAQACMLLRDGQAEEALNVTRDTAASEVERPGYLAAVEGWALTALGNEREAAIAFADARSRDPQIVRTLGRMRQGLADHHFEASARELDVLLAGIAR